MAIGVAVMMIWQGMRVEFRSSFAAWLPGSHETLSKSRSQYERNKIKRRWTFCLRRVPRAPGLTRFQSSGYRRRQLWSGLG